jgi:hypothetical protein
MRRPASVLVVLVLVLMVSLPVESPACYRCKYSPSNFGFCRLGYERGGLDCSEYVADTWTGRTDCNVDWHCYHYSLYTADEGGNPLDEDEVPNYYGENRPCSWTDTQTIRVV